MILRARFAAAILLVACLGGCVVGPNYHPPTPPAGADSPLVSLNPALETPTEPPDTWWRLYSDPELDHLIQLAFANNEDLAVAEANLSAARASLEEARNGLYPQTNINLGAIRGRDPTTSEIMEIGGQKPRTVWLYDDLIDVSYELDLFGRVRRTLQAARADAQAAIAARDSVKVTVAAETTRAYAEVCAIGEELAVARHSLEIATREADIFNRRLQAGGGSEFDLVRAQEVVANASAAIPPLEGQRRAALFQLTALVGQTPSHAPFEAEACVTPPRLFSLVPVGDGASLLRRRPDVRLADRRLAAAIARVGVATADLYPRISLTAFYGGAAPFLNQLASNPGLVWGVGPKINWTFPNQVGVRARIHYASAQSDAALASFDSTVLQALKETEQSLTTYGHELDHRQSLANAQDKARRALDMANGQFAAGAASPLDVLTSEQAVVSADAAVAASDAALIQDQVSVFKALGGGWASSTSSSAAGK
ncbi:MAG: efflux transporter outer membrane subunit [Caulobacteraceae bacterium]|nr:efflux transporter outer membrane subunit [Caulobacteraceae bacterium]